MAVKAAAVKHSVMLWLFDEWMCFLDSVWNKMGLATNIAPPCGCAPPPKKKQRTYYQRSQRFAKFPTGPFLPLFLYVSYHT